MPAVNNVSGSSNVYLEALGSSKIALTPGSIMMLLRRNLGNLDGQIDGMMQEIESNTARSEVLQRQMEGLNLLKAAIATAEKTVDEDGVVRLRDLEIEWEGQTLNGAELLNKIGVTNVPATTLGRDDEQISVSTQADPDRVAAGRAELQELEALAIAEGYPNLAAMEADRIEVQHGRGSGNPLENEGYIDSRLQLMDRAVEARREIERGQGGYDGREIVDVDALTEVISTVQSQSRRMNSGNEVLMVQMQSAMQQRSQAVTLATQMTKSLNDTNNAVARNIGS